MSVLWWRHQSWRLQPFSSMWRRPGEIYHDYTKFSKFVYELNNQSKCSLKNNVKKTKNVLYIHLKKIKLLLFHQYSLNNKICGFAVEYINEIKNVNWSATRWGCRHCFVTFFNLSIFCQYINFVHCVVLLINELNRSLKYSSLRLDTILRIIKTLISLNLTFLSTPLSIISTVFHQFSLNSNFFSHFVAEDYKKLIEMQYQISYC